MTKEKIEGLSIELKEAKLEVLDLKKRLVLNETILQDVLYTILDNKISLHLCEPDRVKRFKDFLVLLKINRRIK